MIDYLQNITDNVGMKFVIQGQAYFVVFLSEKADRRFLSDNI